MSYGGRCSWSFGTGADRYSVRWRRQWLIVAAVIAATACSRLPTAATMAYSWSEVDESIPNIVPFHWIRRADLGDPERMVERAKAATDAMPAGHRALFLWDLHRDMAWHPEDVVRDRSGAPVGCIVPDRPFTPYRGIWWDHGVARASKRVDDWFARFKAAGGSVDVLVLDFEQGFGYWQLYYLAEREYPCGLAQYLNALVQDPRFASIPGADRIDDVERLVDWYRHDDYLRWDAVMHERLAHYIDRVLYEPAAKHFPGIELSNYGYYYQAPALQLPDINGHDQNRYGPGRHVGTHQSRALYGWLANIRDHILDGSQPYRATPFNGFRYAVNAMRAMALSSTVPVSPWVANKEFSQSLLRDSDLYQELILHVALSGIDYLLYWNPLGTDSPATPTSNRLLSHLLTHVDETAGAGHRVPLTQGLVPWSQPYVVTGAMVRGRRIWRFSPDLDGDARIGDTIVSRNPAVFNVRGIRVDFPRGRIVEAGDNLAPRGFWVVETPARCRQAAAGRDVRCQAR